MSSKRTFALVLASSLGNWPRTSAEPLSEPQGSPDIEVTVSTEVRVWIPGFRSVYWDDKIAAVVTSNQESTSYHAFCRTDVAVPCTLVEGSFPFAIGPSMLAYSTTTPTRIVIECDLEGISFATCTGTTAEETTRTHTYFGSDIQWGTLAVGETPASIPTLDITTEPITDSDGRTVDQTDTRVISTPTVDPVDSLAIASKCTPETEFLLRYAAALLLLLLRPVI